MPKSESKYFVSKTAMRKSISTVCLGLCLSLITGVSHIANANPLRLVAPERLRFVGLDSKLGITQVEPNRKIIRSWQTNPNCPASKPEKHKNSVTSWNKSQQQSLVQAIDNSLYYLSTPKAAKSYRKYASSKFNLERTRKSLLRFKELLLTSESPIALEKVVKQEFDFYQSLGKDKRGKVEFTGYFWLSDRLEAFLVQVQGSARLKMTDGSTMSVGYNGTTNYSYVSVGGELVKDGVFGKDELTLPRLLDYFAANPKELDNYIPRNNRFIFFRPTNGKPPTGSLGVPVTGDRSIATDKSILPPGALALIVAPIPDVESSGEVETRVVSRYVLDQDTGSAIKGAGRVDIYLGSGDVAGERAGLLNGNGSLFYLLLKELKL